MTAINVDVITAQLVDLDDTIMHVQLVQVLARKKDKVVPKAQRACVVGRFGLYLVHNKKVRRLAALHLCTRQWH